MERRVVECVAVAGGKAPRHDEPQGVGPASGRVLLVAGDHVARAHGPAGVLAAGADARAHLDGGGEPPLFREVEDGRLGLDGVVVRADPEVVAGVGRGDDLAGVHQVVRVEGALDGFKRRVDLGAEELGVPEAAGEPVAVLAAHRPLELGDEVGDRARDRPERLDPRARLDVQDRPDVQAADVGVAVTGGLGPLPGHDRAEPPVELGELLGGDGRVLDEGDRLGVADHPHQQRQPRLAHLPEVGLVGGLQALVHPDHAGASREPAGEVVGALGQLLRALGVKLRGQDRRRVPAREVELPREGRLRRGEVEDHPVEHLDRDRAGGDHLVQAVERRLDRREREHDQPLRLRHRHELQLGPGDDRQGPLRADDQPREVEFPGAFLPAGRPDGEAGNELVEVIPAHPAENSRELRRDRRAVLGDRRAHGPMNRPDPVVPGADGVQLRGGDRPEGRRRAVGEDDVERPDVIDRLAVAERPGAGRVVADHAAERGAVARRDVRPEHQPERLQVRSEPVEHDPRLDPDRHLVAIDDADPVQVLREIEHHGRPDGLPRQAGRGASGQDGHPFLGRDPDRRDDVGHGARNDHAQGLDLIETGVGRVKPARPAIEINLGAGLAAQSVPDVGGGGGEGVAHRRKSRPGRPALHDRKRNTPRVPAL